METIVYSAINDTANVWKYGDVVALGIRDCNGYVTIQPGHFSNYPDAMWGIVVDNVIEAKDKGRVQVYGPALGRPIRRIAG